MPHKDPIARAEYRKKHYQANKEKLYAQHRALIEKNAEARAEYLPQYREAHPQKHFSLYLFL